MKRRIVFRADGGAETGLGHIIRTLSLTELLKPHFQCLFILNDTDASVKQMVEKACDMMVINTTISGEPEILKTYLRNTDILVTDGYHFNELYQSDVKKMVHKLVMVDDKADMFFDADVIFNHGDISSIPPYRKSPHTQVYSGFPYLIMRKEFMEAAQQNRIVSIIDTAFICMGGSDPYNITLKVMRACIQALFIKKIIVVTGGVFSHKQTLLNFLTGHPNAGIEHYENIPADKMVTLIKQSQLAFSTSSSIALEICCVKTGLLSGMIIDNQQAIHHQLVTNQCCMPVGNWTERTVDEICEHIHSINNLSAINEMMKRQKEKSTADRVIES